MGGAAAVDIVQGTFKTDMKVSEGLSAGGAGRTFVIPHGNGERDYIQRATNLGEEARVEEEKRKDDDCDQLHGRRLT
jgi:hypothetical protein